MARIEVIKQKYSQEGLWSATKEVPVQGWNLVKENPYKTAATFVAIAAAISLTAAYFMSPAYAAFVGTVGTKAATLVSPAITAVSAFLVAHPLFASLIIAASVVALMVAPMYAYKNSSKASQIDEVKKEILKVCERDGDNPKIENDKLKFIGHNASTFLNGVAVAVGLASAPAPAPAK